jgi:hypothetical protein
MNLFLFRAFGSSWRNGCEAFCQLRFSVAQPRARGICGFALRSLAAFGCHTYVYACGVLSLCDKSSPAAGSLQPAAAQSRICGSRLVDVYRLRAS